MIRTSKKVGTAHLIILAFLFSGYIPLAQAATLRVGTQHELKTIASAAKQAQDGDIIEVESGNYIADVALWSKNRLTIRGIGQRPRIIANGAACEEKAIWVVRGGEITVDNFEFSGAKVGDKNGAGIRFESGHLTIKNSRFTGNENGILTDSGDMTLNIENSEFDNNGAGDGQSHNLYVGEIRRLRVTGSYFHHANVGHLLKTRAAENHITYNRLTDEVAGRASYELEFPNGGIAHVIGNIIEQSVTTENSTLISYGAEGYKHRTNRLYLINNTLIDRKSASIWPWNPGGSFLIVYPGSRSVKALNNLLVGKSSLPDMEGVFFNNLNVNKDIFVAPDHYDLRIKGNASADFIFETPVGEKGEILSPTREYLHLSQTQRLPGAPHLPGARQTQTDDASGVLRRTHAYEIPPQASPIAALFQELLTRTPGELMRYAERRLIGHPKLEAVSLPIFNFLRPFIERPVSRPLPTLGKGQQTQALPFQRYTTDGQPIPINQIASDEPSSQPGRRVKLLTSIEEIRDAITQAQPGDTLEIMPGIYKMPGNLRIRTGGLPGQPIVLRASKPGSVIIESTALEGFHVLAPWWVFENLVIRGVCAEHTYCEHAFHIVGKAKNVVIRNNRLEDFNAQIKVNGLEKDFPDNGLVQYNTLTNTGSRNTVNPVTPIDIVAADRWVIADNLISNFVKGNGDRISYGAFMKGSGSKGSIERNLVICTTENISQPGNRVGLSLGGGGTGKSSCRDKRCITEYSQGRISDNIIAHCNDFGIYINEANQSIISNNTLANTYGIDVRFPVASAHIEGNTLDGVIRSRDDASITESGNQRRRVVNFPK